MGRLERLAVRCALGVLAGAPTGELVFCSRHGNAETLSALLRGICEKELMSPMAFSGSVHNAAPGLVGQIRKERISHTALAAGSHTFEAGLIESYARLVTDECGDVTLAFADLVLPELYRAFEDDVPCGIALTMRLELAEDDEDDGAIAVQSGRAGVIDLCERLSRGPVRLDLAATLPMGAGH